MTLAQDIFDVIRGKKVLVIEDKIKNKKKKKTSAKTVIDIPLPKTTHTINKNKKIIAVDGFCWSGSSVIVDILSEFRDVKVFGSNDAFSGDTGNIDKIAGEFKFFIKKEAILNFSKVFNKTEDERDIAIKKFIEYFYSAAKLCSKNEAFRENFLDININFLNSVLDLDDYTKEYLKGKNFPQRLFLSKDDYKNCSFVYDKCESPYLLYKFKQGMTQEEFNNYIADYIWSFFDNIKFDNLLVLDQFFSNSMYLDDMNYFMNEHPIKEICVYRDPRDQYVAWFKEAGVRHIKTPKEFIKYMIKDSIPKIKAQSENRLCVRFEDIIFDYEKTLNKVLEFTGIDKKDHIQEGKIFIPDISRKNVGIYKTFHNQDAIKMIEAELKEYCYDNN